MPKHIHIEAAMPDEFTVYRSVNKHKLSPRRESAKTGSSSDKKLSMLYAESSYKQYATITEFVTHD